MHGDRHRCNGENDKKDRKKKRKRIIEQSCNQTDDDREVLTKEKKRRKRNKEKSSEDLLKRSHRENFAKEAKEEQSLMEVEQKPCLASPVEYPSSSSLGTITKLKQIGEGDDNDYSKEQCKKEENQTRNKTQKQLLEGQPKYKDVKATENRKKEKKKKSKGGVGNGNLWRGVDGEPGREESSMDKERVLNYRSKQEKKKKRKDKIREGSHVHHKENDLSIPEAGLIEFDGSPNDDVNRKPTLKEACKERKKQNKGRIDAVQNKVMVSDGDQDRNILNNPAHTKNENTEDDVEEIWGVRFTPEEDQILKDAVWDYIKEKGWDQQAGLHKIFNSRKYTEAHNCWADIKSSLPHRPRQAVRNRARLLLESGNHLGKWSKEEEDLLRQLQTKDGNQWRKVSHVLDRHRSCIKEKWRTLKRSETVKKKGRWSQDDLQQLAQAVHEFLRLKTSQPETEKKDRHILRSNIGWESIANTLGHHNHGSCCTQWYRFFQSSLVTDGQWSTEDDFMLLKGLLESGASAEEEVDWDNLLDHRSGGVCLTRWKQMVKYVGDKQVKQFLDILDALVHRYAPDLVAVSLEENL